MYLLNPLSLMHMGVWVWDPPLRAWITYQQSVPPTPPGHNCQLLLSQGLCCLCPIGEDIIKIHCTYTDEIFK